MKSFALTFLFLVVFSVSVIWAFFPQPDQLGGFLFGLSLFSVNLFLLTILVRRFLSAASPRAKGGVAFSGLMLLKLLLIGLGLYIGIVRLELSPWFLVGGATAGLFFLSIAAWFGHIGRETNETVAGS